MLYEVITHYQIHRGIGVHHAEALERGVPLRVNIFVGGPPSLTVAAVMPLPEGMPELAFAGLLGGHRLPLVCRPGELPMPAEADFVITGSFKLLSDLVRERQRGFNLPRHHQGQSSKEQMQRHPPTGAGEVAMKGIGSRHLV